MTSSSVNFSDLGICPEILEAIEVLGFETPSAIQEQAIPAAIAGNDVVGLSYTGSGKTLAFVIPALELAEAGEKSVQVLALCPTRELAVQVCREVDKLALFLDGISAVPVYGGSSFKPQLDAFRRGVQVVVGTPGRILDHVESGALRLDKLRMLILDEADEMLDMGFKEDIERIVEKVPEERQTLFFSATMSNPIKNLIGRWTKDAKMISIERPALSVPPIEQIYHEVVFSSRIEVLSRLLETGRVKLGIVFANTKRTVDDIVDGLVARGYAVDRLHGDMPQNLRERVMDSFRRGSLRLLVATDIAARGIDVDNIDTVINFDLPRDPEDYVHRIGRTARAGRSGRAITLLGRRDFSLMSRVERFIGMKIRREPVLTATQVKDLHRESLVDEILERIKPEASMPTELSDIEAEKDQLIAALFQLLHDKTSRPTQSIPEDRPSKHDAERERNSTRNSEPRGEDGFTPRQTIEGDTISLFMNAGKALGILPKDIVGMIYNCAELPKGAVGDVRLFQKHSIIEIAAEFAPIVLEKLATTTICGFEVNVREDKGIGYSSDKGGNSYGGGDRRPRGEGRGFGGGDRGGRSYGGSREDRSSRGDRGGYGGGDRGNSYSPRGEGRGGDERGGRSYGGGRSYSGGGERRSFGGGGDRGGRSYGGDRGR